MKVIDKIALIYIEDNKVLATLSKGKDKYYIPGGKREENETDQETLIRECKEELNIDIIKDTIKYYETFEAQADGKTEGILVKVTCYMAQFNGEIKASSEIEEIKWLSYSDIDKASHVNKLIIEELFNKKLIK